MINSKHLKRSTNVQILTQKAVRWQEYSTTATCSKRGLCTCFTSTNVQILTQKTVRWQEYSSAAICCKRGLCTCFTSTNVQILTQKTVRWQEYSSTATCCNVVSVLLLVVGVGARFTTRALLHAHY